MAPAVRRYVISFLLAFYLLNFIQLFFPDDSFALQRRFFSRRYTLSGSMELSYERKWVDGRDAVAETFRQDYNLKLSGFIVDPRLVMFDISGDLTDTNRRGSGSDSTLTGLNLNVTLISSFPKKWLRYWMFIPNPIRLNYSTYSGDYDSTNFGISMEHTKPAILTPKKGRLTRETVDTGIPFPRTYLDYNRYIFETEKYSSTVDIFSIRSSIVKGIYNYKILYENHDQTGTTKYNRSLLRFEPDYRFYDYKARRFFGIRNTLRMQEINEKKTIDVGTKLSWYKLMDRDSLRLSGDAIYSSVSDDSDSQDIYNTSASAVYLKTFSSALRNSASLSLGFGKSDLRDTYFTRVSDTVTADISRIFRVQGQFLAGVNQEGDNYGIGASLSTKTALNTTTSYSLESRSTEDGKLLSHTVRLSASAPITRNLSFKGHAQYLHRDVSKNIDPYSSEYLSSFGSLFLRFERTSLTLSCNYSMVQQENGATTRSSITTFNATLSRLLTRDVFFNVFSTWSRDSDDKKTLELRPRLSWRRVNASLNLEYDYRRISDSGGDDTASHRFFLRFVRRFPRLL